MNGLGTLATKIVDFDFSEDSCRFPVSYVSGWLEENIGELNALLFHEFYVTDSGDIEYSEGCGLNKAEESIFKALYEIHYYEKMARDTLLNLSSSSSWTTLREGDTVIQKTSKNAVAKTYREAGNASIDRMNDLISKYNLSRSAPLQVFGSDGA